MQTAIVITQTLVLLTSHWTMNILTDHIMSSNLSRAAHADMLPYLTVSDHGATYTYI